MKNVILMAMSTLRTDKNDNSCFGVEKTKFEYVGDDGKVTEIDDCRSQLEPIVKLMIEKDSSLEANGLELVILCTSKTKDDEKSVKCDGIKESEKEYSAVDYFEHRIDKYIESKGCNIECRKYTEINIDERKPLEGIKLAIAHIRKLYHDNNNELKFWIDTHGGLRDISLINNAIISVLRLENPMYTPEKILGVEYGTNGVSKIIEQRGAFEIFRFVSGMEAFSLYGSADVLVDYFKEDKECVGIVKSMNEVSDGIQECNSDKYVNGLSTLKNNINKIESSNSWIGIFKDYIESDYGELIKGEGIAPISIIKRCIEKKMYQQALTLIESLMPEYFIKNKVLYYASEYSTRIIGCRENEKKEYLSEEHFLFDKYIWRCSYKNNNFGINEFKECMEECFEYADTQFIKEEPLDIGNGVKIQLKTDISNEKYKIAGKLMRMHKGLKKCRNLFNHSNPDRPTIGEVVKVMNAYVEAVEEIMENSQGEKICL